MDLQFETGELIRLHTEVSNDEVHIDFAGTSTSSRLFLMDSATYGTCLGAFLSFLGEDFLLNEGIFSILNVTTPQGCFLNARYPSPVFEGMVEASPLLATAVVQSLASIGSAKTLGINGAIPTVLNLQFDSGKTYMDLLAGGTGATSEGDGIDGYYFWNLVRLQTSVEEIERLYPILILQSGIRQASGGKGKSTGGNGVLREIELKENCTFKWLTGHRNTQMKGLKGATSGQAAEITVRKAKGEEVPLTKGYGQMTLEKGDRIIATSAGGGGFGKAAESKNPAT
jgi:N-methylhydantoinase B